jgi:DASH complex subunit DAM1
MPGPTPHRTPLRRVSQGSLFALSRSGAHPDAPHGLGFLEPALAELADEADALRANVDGLRALSASLDTFNEAFASWMYVMNMNALTVDWPEVCGRFFIISLCDPLRSAVVVRVHLLPAVDPGSPCRHRRTRRSSSRSGGQVRFPLDIDPLDRSSPSRNAPTTEEDALAAAAAAQVQAQAHTLGATAMLDETTNATALVDSATFADGSLAPGSSKSAVAKVKKKGKPKLTPKEKKERSVRTHIFPSSSREGVRSHRVVVHEDGD